MEKVPIVTGATAYDDPNGTTSILIFNESLYYGTKLAHSLTYPNQLRHNAVDFWDNPYDKERYLEIETKEELIIPITSKGTKLIFTTQVPTREELSTCQLVNT